MSILQPKNSVSTFASHHLLVKCPKCLAAKGSKCRGPDSSAISNSHKERVSVAIDLKSKFGPN